MTRSPGQRRNRPAPRRKARGFLTVSQSEFAQNRDHDRIKTKFDRSRNFNAENPCPRSAGFRPGAKQAARRNTPGRRPALRGQCSEDRRGAEDAPQVAGRDPNHGKKADRRRDDSGSGEAIRPEGTRNDSVRGFPGFRGFQQIGTAPVSEALEAVRLARAADVSDHGISGHAFLESLE